jgi:hypothetical protein
MSRLGRVWRKCGGEPRAFTAYVWWGLRSRVHNYLSRMVRKPVNDHGAERAVYLSLSELSRRHRASEGPSRSGALTEHEIRCFSQNGEDGVIAEILARIGCGREFFVEFGVEDGREGNCVFLADVLGWNGLFIEADRAKCAALARKYSGVPGVTTLNVTVTPENIEGLLAHAGAPSEPTVLSVDVDGNDYWIWQAVERYHPRVVVIEYNAGLPPGCQLVQPREHAFWDGTDFFGASLWALCSLAERKGYRLVHTELAATNAFFVRGDLASERFPPADEVPHRHEPNYLLRGGRHPPDPLGRKYTDVSRDTTC